MSANVVVWGIRRVAITVLVLVSARVFAQENIENEIQILEENSCGCPNKPLQNYSCEIQKNMVQGCNSQSVIDGDYCAFSCGRCVCVNGCMCTNYPPDNQFTCQQLSEFGKCSEAWMLIGDYCQASCGRCPSNCSSPQEETGDAQLMLELQLMFDAPEIEFDEYEYFDSIQSWSATNDNYFLPPISYQPTGRSQDDVNQFLPDCSQDLLNILDKYTELQYMKNLILDNPMMKYYELQSRSQPLTWFVPSQTSMLEFVDSLTATDIFNNQVNMWQLFSGHIVRGYYSREDLYKVDQLETIRTQNITITSNIEQQQIIVGDSVTTAYVIEGDLRSCVSIVHVLDGVIVHPNSPIKAFLPEPSPSPSPLPPKSTTPSQQTKQKELQSQQNCQTPLNLINSDPRLDFFAKLIKIAGVEAQLDQIYTNLTIFVPLTSTQPDENELLQLDGSVIQQLVLYHIVPNLLVNISEIKSSYEYQQGQSQIELNMYTLLSKLFFNLILQEEDTLLQGVSRSAKVVQEDFRHSCNVVIHTIDQFIEPYPQLLSGPFQTAFTQQQYSINPSPTPVPSCYISAWDFILSQTDLQILQNIPISQVDEWLTRPELNVTIFMPDSGSLQYLLSISKLLSSPNQSLENTEQILYDLILYHIIRDSQIPNLMNSNNSKESYRFDTMASSLPVYVMSSDIMSGGAGMSVQGVGSSASVVNRRSDCQGSGLEVYYLNGYLLPFSSVNMGMEGFPSKQELSLDFDTHCSRNESLVEFLKDSPKFSRLIEMLGDDLDRILTSYGSGTATYFLPTNDAIEQLLLSQEIVDIFASQIELGSLILQYHTIPDQLLTTKSILQMPKRILQNHLTKFNGLQIGIQKIFGGLMLTGEMGVARLISLEDFVSCDSIVHLIDTVLFPFQISNNSTLTNQLDQNQQVDLYEEQFSTNYEVSVDYNYILPLEFVQPESIIDSSVDTYETQLDTQNLVLSLDDGVDMQYGNGTSSFLDGIIEVPSPVPTQQVQRQGCDMSLGSVQNSRFTTALQYFREAGYGYMLDKLNADFTLFAPLNEAFEKNLTGYNMSLTEMKSRPEMHDLFVKIMRYHIVLYPVSGNIPFRITGMFTTQAFDDDGQQLSIKMTKYMEPYALRETIQIEGQINNATLSGSQLKICDAYIYPIDQVLSLVENQQQDTEMLQYIPPVRTEFKPSIDHSSLIPYNSELSFCLKPMHQIQNQNELVLFNQMIHYANLSSHINAIQNITIFAPVDSGILQLLGSNISQIPLQNIEHLIAYHIVQGVYTLDNLMQGQQLESLQVDANGIQMALTIDLQQQQQNNNNNILIKGKTNFGKIIRQNISACHSIIHIIDAPLSPW